MSINADIKQAQRDAADHRALHDYVEALPHRERVAYYRANPDYMLYGYPAHLVQRANALTAAGDADAGQAILRDWQHAQWSAEAAARPASSLTFAGRVFAAFIGLWIPAAGTLAAAGVAAVTMGPAGVHVALMLGGAATAGNALLGFATGWQA